MGFLCKEECAKLRRLVQTERSHSNWRAEIARAVRLQFLASAICVYLELLGSAYDFFWLGLLPGQLLGIAIGTLVYFVLLSGVGVGLTSALATRSRLTVSLVLGSIDIAILVAFFFAQPIKYPVGTEQPDPVPRAFIVAAIAFVIAMTTLSHRWDDGSAKAKSWFGAVFVSLALGCCALLLGPRVFIRPETRVIFSVALSFATIAAALVAGTFWVTWCARRSRGVLFALAPYFVVCVLLPVVLRWGPEVISDGERSRKQNLLLLTSDTLRTDILSVYGGPVNAPNVQKLADRATHFDYHYSLAPWTLPSFSGLFSSRYPLSLTPNTEHKLLEFEVGSFYRLAPYLLPKGATLLGQELMKRGYSTAAYCTNPTVSALKWLKKGFDSWEVTGVVQLDGPRGPLALFSSLANLISPVWPGARTVRPIDYTVLLTRYVKDFLRHHRSQPFFIWAHFMDPHTPYDPPSRFRTEPFTNDNLPYPPPGAKLDENLVRSLHQAEVAYVDEQLGIIMNEVDRLGLRDNTYMIFSSDHGEELFEHGKFGHGMTLFEEQVRVPLLIAGPGIRHALVKTPISAIDLIPTLAELAHVPSQPAWRGRGFAATLTKGVPLKARVVFFQGTGLLPKPPEPLQGLRRGNFKLIRGMNSGKLRLYDLKRDSRELRDIAPAAPGIIRILEPELTAWRQSFPESIGMFHLLRKESIEPNTKAIQNLKALGYVE